MITEEKELRKAANNLILVLGMSEQFRQGLDSFDALLSMSDYEQRAFENPTVMSPFPPQRNICAHRSKSLKRPMVHL